MEWAFSFTFSSVGSVHRRLRRPILPRSLAPTPTPGPFPGKPFPTMYRAHLFPVGDGVEAGGIPFSFNSVLGGHLFFC